MRQIFRTKFGSHLYGTSTPASDTDFKSVFIPDGVDIVMQRAPRVIDDSREKAVGERNVAGDVEEQKFALHRYLEILAGGDMMALDMLFAPDSVLTDDPLFEWRWLQEHKIKLLSRRPAGFMGYIMTQAKKYGIRGSRVAAVRAAIAELDVAIARFGNGARLSMISTNILSLCLTVQHMEISADRDGHGKIVEHWKVCDRKMPLTVTLKYARDILQRLFDAYGHRALLAETNQGVDWKALSHAVRVAEQAIELLTTGEITFPLRNADRILEIKQGLRDYKSVAAEIEGLLSRVETAADESKLPEAPDQVWIDRFIYDSYRAAVIRE